MAGTTSMSGGGATVPRHSMEESEVTGWVGWIVFAGTMMMILGVFHMFQGLIALFQQDLVTKAVTTTATNNVYFVTIDTAQWGWLHLVAGALVFLAGIGLFTGRMWARTLGVVLVSISALINFVFLGWYPFWSLTLLVIDFFVLYAIIAHGSEMKTARATE